MEHDRHPLTPPHMNKHALARELAVSERLTITTAYKAFTDFAVTALTNCRFSEIVRQTDPIPDSDRWFRAKLDYITLDERTARERHTKQNVLFQGSCFDHAKDAVATYIAGFVADIRLLALTETNIIDVITN